MNIKTLSNQDLASSLDSLALKERENTVEFLRHLIEFDSRLLYREMGYSSLYDYCLRRLRLSDGGTFRRITAARCLRDNPELAELLLKGEVTLCSVAAAAKSIERKVTAVTEIVGCSKKEVEAIVALSNPVQVKPKEVMKPVVIKRTPEKREERVKLEFSVSKEEFEAFKRVQSELSVEAGKALSLEELFGKLLKNRKKTSKRVRVRSSETRYVPKAVKREVFARDNGQCCFVAPDGTRCCERKHLQFDHIHPFAKGGLTQTSNLRLLCPAHNRLMAEREFGFLLPRRGRWPRAFGVSSVERLSRGRRVSVN